MGSVSAVVKISEVRQITVSQGDTTFVFLADHEAGRLVIRQESEEGEDVCALTVSDRAELDGFLTGLRRVLGVEQGPGAAEPPRRPQPSVDGGRPEVGAGEEGEDREAAIERARQRNPSAFKSWTRDEERRLADAYREGTPIAELAKAHERSPRAIEMRLAKLGLRDAG